ncbi:MAG: hypothetical protein ACI306_04745 [Muribaculaceae bacterium]
MKKFTLPMALALSVTMPVVAYASSADDTMTLSLLSAQEPQVIAIDDIKELTFSTEAMTIVSHDNEPIATVEWADLGEITFQYDPSGVADIAAADAADAADAVYYDLTGRRVLSENMRPGLYIVKSGNRAYKTLIR